MNIKTVSVIFRKELKETLRDKRSFFISVIFPVILFPLIFSVLDANIRKANTRIRDSFEIGLDEKKGAFAGDFLLSQNRFTIEKNSPYSKLKEGKVYAVVKSDVASANREITIIFDNSRQQSITAAAELAALFKAVSESGPVGRSSGFIFRQETLYSSSTGSSMLILSTLLPFLMFVFAALSPVALASDTGAGEKERYTIEPLLATPAAKTEILAGKYLCLNVMGLIGTVAFAAGIIISTILTPDVFGFEKLEIYLNLSSAVLLFISAVFLTMLFSSAELLLSLAARSPKEAQILFLPLMMVTMTAGYSTSVIDPLNIENIYRHIPLLNISILIKEFSLNILDFRSSALTFTWVIIYISICLLFSKVLISRETIVRRE